MARLPTVGLACLAVWRRILARRLRHLEMQPVNWRTVEVPTRAWPSVARDQGLLAAPAAARGWVVVAADSRPGSAGGRGRSRLVAGLHRLGLGTLELGSGPLGPLPARAERLAEAARWLLAQPGAAGAERCGVVALDGEVAPALVAAAMAGRRMAALVALAGNYEELTAPLVADVQAAVRLIAAADQAAAARRVLGWLDSSSSRGSRHDLTLLARSLADPVQRRAACWLAGAWLSGGLMPRAAGVMEHRRATRRLAFASLALTMSPLSSWGAAGRGQVGPGGPGQSSRLVGEGGQPWLAVAPSSAVADTNWQQEVFAALPGTIALSSLDGTTGLKLNGALFSGAGEQAGFSVAAAGDVNGDGSPDLLIGAPRGSGHGSSTGQAYVIYGGSGLAATITLSSLSAATGLRMVGTASGDIAGWSVAGAGDVNNDGFDDVVIGAQHADPGGNSALGASYVVFGGSALPATLELSSLNGTNGFAIHGVSSYDFVGASVAGPGDVNNDGFDDVLIGGSGADPNGDLSGAAYVVYGGSAMIPVFSLAGLNAFNGLKLEGAVSGERAGSAVAGAGDIDDDGFADLLVGAPSADPHGGDSGRAYLVYGGSDLPATLGLGALGSAGVRIEGVGSDAKAGFSLSAAGDVNGDGFGDLLIGAPQLHNYTPGPGRTYVVYGGPGLPGTIELSELGAGTGFVVNGISSGDLSGHAVAGVGDINLDGFDDVLIGAYRSNVNGVGSGQAYLVYGGSSIPASISLATLGAEGVRLDGAAGASLAGCAVAGPGDVDGDGYNDLLIGAYSFNGFRGQSYLVYGDGNPAANLGITKDDGVTSVAPGGVLTYTITVGNAGPSAATGVIVSDDFPNGCATVSTTSVANGGATGNTAGPFAGDIAEVLALPVGANVVYTAVCTLDPTAGGSVSNTVTVASPLVDPNPANNSATDSDMITGAALFADGFETGNASRWSSFDSLVDLASVTAVVVPSARAELAIDLAALSAVGQIAPTRIALLDDVVSGARFELELRRSEASGWVEARVRMVASAAGKVGREPAASAWVAIRETARELVLERVVGKPGDSDGALVLYVDGRAEVWLPGVEVSEHPALLRVSTRPPGAGS